MPKSKDVTDIANQIAAKLSETAAKAASNLASTPNIDHDLLIRLEENVNQNFKQVKDAISELKDGMTVKIGDHEIRLRSIETKQWVMVGGLTILSFITPYVWSLFK